MSFFRTLQFSKGAVSLFANPKFEKSLAFAKYIEKNLNTAGKDIGHLPFDFEETTTAPTLDQLLTIKSFVDEKKGIVPSTFTPAQVFAPAQPALKAAGKTFPDDWKSHKIIETLIKADTFDNPTVIRPILVDWEKGQVAIDDLEAAKKLWEELILRQD
ncbi:hypothetical protein B0I72DRAFT_141943 [Yarrowia lipolytica]|uniref:Thioredoxin-like protein n=1 Tax=Yarrowia lipolytica TaxID=4952 RepID=A0A371BZV1_YARLL|nr:hypothetical protein B0I71DRAFT_135666 [Yarrowia lipolytica]RDW30205.1 hypothetical protein B0I72DRAFT_141943 [Yarrowia lipolytica]